LDNEDPKHIKERLESHDIAMDATQSANVARDMIYKAIGLDKLDKETKAKLNLKFEAAGFDFKTATAVSVKAKIDDDTFMGTDEEFNKKVREHLLSIDI
jgi:hypothetical protein